ncbi:hypothetical protein SAMN05428989_2729 [Pseudoxanthomonas sp. GM95]|uniref:DUF6928 family protein n=1 Tax=Pseudoxanthomonas sp. GM95 TaxID=1881043 RepID=UPI0008C813A9|nr:hypothetical protein [Pseudoxanthomonas sp. GM95]SEL86607.1 hypothetical protein SAMN05428989_2729 [Pseudoxanthomonas sp. GM95]
MGAKTWMLVQSEQDARYALAKQPGLDRAATHQLAARMFPGEMLEFVGEGSLSFTSPPDDEIYLGCFPGVSIVAAAEFALDYPSQLPMRFIERIGAGTVTLHAMHSVVDWLAFAQWRDRHLIRSLSLSPDSGVLENIGSPFKFEMPFWAGDHPAIDPAEAQAGETYPFVFHPLELGEAALAAFFGYQLEGVYGTALAPLDSESIPLLIFKRVKTHKKAWWKFW